jgi:hypothetical protein
MRIFSAAVIGAVTLGAVLAGSASASAQSAPTEPTHKRIYGYQDLATGTFHPMVRAVPDAASVTPTTGKYEVSFAVTIESSFARGAVIGCEVAISELTTVVTATPPYESGISYTEIATGSVAAGAAGTKATCTVSLPYSWVIPAATKTSKVTSTITGSYTVSAYNPTATLTVATLEGLREVESQLPIPATVPKDGATTSAIVDVTL